jgi:hypothetical protein
MRDIEAIWFGQATELARRMDALADEMDAAGHHDAARAIRDVLNCEHNPLPDKLPELGDPPTLRPAVPPRLTLPPPIVEHAARRASDPGA